MEPPRSTLWILLALILIVAGVIASFFLQGERFSPWGEGSAPASSLIEKDEERGGRGPLPVPWKDEEAQPGRTGIKYFQ